MPTTASKQSSTVCPSHKGIKREDNLPLSGSGISLGIRLPASLGLGSLRLPASIGVLTIRLPLVSSGPVTTLSVPVISLETTGGEGLLPAVNVGGITLSSLVLGSGLLVLLGLGLTVEVKIGHDVPDGLAGGKGSTETEDLTGEHPPGKTDGVTGLVVDGDGHINELGRGVDVAKGDDGDVDVRSLLDGLDIGPGVGNNDQAGLLERAGDVVGEVTGGEATGNGLGTGVSGELEDGTLSIGTSRDDTDVGRVVDGGDDTGSKDDLLPVSVKTGLEPMRKEKSRYVR